MCNLCKNLPLTEHFNGPEEFLETVEVIKQLIAKDFVLIEGTPHNIKKGGVWVEDSFTIIIKCKACKEQYVCYANTYRGGGRFYRLDKK